MFTAHSSLLAFKRMLRGYMLIELMISVTIGLFLLHLIFAIYLTHLRSHRLQIALSQIQHHAETAIRILRKEIHRAGYIGCARLTHDFPLTSDSSYKLTPQNKIISLKPDEITVSHMSLSNAELMQTMQDSSLLVTNHPIRFNAGDRLMISDCKQADIVQATEVKSFRDGQMIYLTHPLSHHYEPHAEVGRLETNTYFIAKTKRVYGDRTPVYSLFVKDNRNEQAELVEGIQRMTIRYAIHQTGRMVEVPANENLDKSQVIGVAIDLNVVAPPLNKVWYLFAALEGQPA